MIVGVGTDIVAISRIAAALERHGERFAARILRPEELALLCRQGELSCFVAGRCVEKRFCDHRLVRKCDHGSRVGKRCLQGEPEASLVYFCDS